MYVTPVVDEIARTCQRAAADVALEGVRVLVLVLHVLVVVVLTVEDAVTVRARQTGASTRGHVTLERMLQVELALTQRALVGFLRHVTRQVLVVLVAPHETFAAQIAQEFVLLQVHALLVCAVLAQRAERHAALLATPFTVREQNLGTDLHMRFILVLVDEAFLAVGTFQIGPFANFFFVGYEIVLRSKHGVASRARVCHVFRVCLVLMTFQVRLRCKYFVTITTVDFVMVRGAIVSLVFHSSAQYRCADVTLYFPLFAAETLVQLE